MKTPKEIAEKHLKRIKLIGYDTKNKRVVKAVDEALDALRSERSTAPKEKP